MQNRIESSIKANGELYFQVLLLFLVYLFYAYERRNPTFTVEKVAYFFNYVWATWIISFYLMPKYFYNKQQANFAIGVFLVFVLVILLEELLLEKIFYPETRGKRFPGIIFTLTQVTPVVVILSGFKFAWDAFKKQKEVDNLKLAMKESEMLYLKNQINPHFLFNNLNNLYSLALENSPKTPEIILALSDMMRYMLYESKDELVTIEKEINHLITFNRVSELHLEGRGSINFEVGQIVPATKIAPLVFSTFVENAVKHSNASLHQGIEINIRLSQQSNKIFFTCVNNYSTESNIKDLNSGIGLNNVKKRLENIYPNKHKLEINQNIDVYTVNLEINTEP